MNLCLFLSVGVAVLGTGLLVEGDHYGQSEGVVVGNPNDATLCETIRPGDSPGLDMIRASCELQDDDLYPSMGYRNVLLRDYASLGPGLASFRSYLTSSFGQACGSAAFRYLCYQFVPRCDTSGQDANVVWNETIVRENCDDVSSECTASQFVALKQQERVCESRYEIRGMFKVGECRKPDASLLSPNCTSMASLMVPSYYHELYSKVDQQFIDGSLSLLEDSNSSRSCQEAYLGLACWPGFVCKDGLYLDVRDRNACQKAMECTANTGVMLPVSNCSYLAQARPSSSAHQPIPPFGLHLAGTIFVFMYLRMVIVF